MKVIDKAIKYLIEQEDINKWTGIDKEKNKIEISQINSDEFFVNITDKKGNIFKNAMLNTLDKAIKFVENVLKSTVKWVKEKKKVITKNGFFGHKNKIRSILLGR